MYGKLPQEVDAAVPDFDSVIELLRMVEGETVFVGVEPPVGAAEIYFVGTLAYAGAAPGQESVKRFTVGPHAEVRLDPSALDAAHLFTFDGNDFFHVRLTYAGWGILISDPHSQVLPGE